MKKCEEVGALAKAGNQSFKSYYSFVEVLKEMTGLLILFGFVVAIREVEVVRSL